jgi:MFS family permease
MAPETRAATLREELRDLPRAFWVLWVGTLVNRFGSFVFPFLALYAVQLGHSATIAGAAVGAYGAGGLVSALAGGEMADRLGRRLVIVFSMAGSAATMLALAAVHGTVALIAVAALAGAATELYRPAAAALIADIVPAGRRVGAFGAYRLAVNLGFAAGPAVAGLLARDSFTWLFVGDAITSLVFLAIALAFLPRDREIHAAAASDRLPVRALLDDRPFAWLLGSFFLIAFVFFQFVSGLPLHVAEAGHSTAVYGALLSINGLLIVVAELPITAWTRRADPRRAMALGNVLGAVGFAATGLTEAPGLLAITVVVWTLGEMVAAPVSSAYVADLAPPGAQGRYQGAFGLTGALALVVAPVGGAALYAITPAALWGTCLVAGCLAALISLRLPAASPRTRSPDQAGSSP